MPYIVNQKIVIVTGRFNASNQFSANIAVNFDADLFILRGYSISNAVAGDEMLIMRSSLIDENILLHFQGNVNAITQSTKIPFKLTHKPINNQYTFTLMTINNGALTNAATVDTYVAMTLEFIQYKTK